MRIHIPTVDKESLWKYLVQYESIHYHFGRRWTHGVPTASATAAGQRVRRETRQKAS